MARTTPVVFGAGSHEEWFVTLGGTTRSNRDAVMNIDGQDEEDL